MGHHRGDDDVTHQLHGLIVALGCWFGILVRKFEMRIWVIFLGGDDFCNLDW